MCNAIAGSEPVKVLVNGATERAQAQSMLRSENVVFVEEAYGDIWLRDTAPIFTFNDGVLVANCFAKNGWGGRFDFPMDRDLDERIAALEGIFARKHSWILEGGAIEVDGQSCALTTRQCLLNPNRNASMDQSAVERALAEQLGIERVLWLDQGLQNDHTDGHIDTLARFVAPGHVVCMEPAPDDPNASTLETIIRELRGAQDARGRRLEVATVPSPGAVRDGLGELLPASYLNFYLGNHIVVVPTYGTSMDDSAVAGIAELFPNRRTLGLSARAILTGGGAFHCITAGQPVGTARE
jgi:agmatine deiminase